LKAGTHVFAVYGKCLLLSPREPVLLVMLVAVIFSTYQLTVKFLLGDNFFKSANYTIEALCAAPFSEEKENLRSIEAQILSKRAEISKFEAEYREVGT